MSGLAEHALRPGAVAARLGSKQRPRVARAEAARVGRWWPWLDSNGVTLFIQQYDQATCRRLQRQQYELLINTWYLCTWYVWSPYHTKKMKCLFLPRASH